LIYLFVFHPPRSFFGIAGLRSCAVEFVSAFVACDVDESIFVSFTSTPSLMEYSAFRMFAVCDLLIVILSLGLKFTVPRQRCNQNQKKW